MGSKRKLLSQILPLFPAKIGTFVDLFCGGCTVGLNVDASKVIFNDNLIYIIELYKTFCKLSKEQVLEHIESRIKEFSLSKTNQEGYLSVRKLYNEKRNPLDLFVLLCYSFTNQIRFNNKHEFNQAFGMNASHFSEHQKNNLGHFIDALHSKNCIFSALDFDKADLSKLTENDFVYCDPPYLITCGSYNDGKRGFTGWDDKLELKLYKILGSLNERHIKFAFSNVMEHKGKENTLLRNWIVERKYKVCELEMQYSINRKGTGTVHSKEVLIINY